GRSFDATDGSLVDLDREKKLVAGAAPAQRTAPAAAHRLATTPDFEAARFGGFKADADESRIIGIALRRAKADQGEDSRLREQVVGRALRITHLQRWQGGDGSSGCRIDQSHVDCGGLRSM